jgi:hypothetical protein
MYLLDFGGKKMRKTAIGIALLLSGLAVTLGLIASAATVVSTLTSWSSTYPSKLFYVIFSGFSLYDTVSSGFGLGWLFVLGYALAVLGLAALGVEYFRKGEGRN